MRSLGVAALLVLMLTGTGCGGTPKGQVVDAETGQPIQGAVVLGVWTRVAGLPGLHHHELVAVKETETDAQGRFALETPASLRVDEEAITIYKFGYVAWSNLFVFPSFARREDTRVPSKIPLERFPSGQSHQRHMSFVNDARASGMYGHDSIPKFSNAIRRELDMR